jgi:hypothetical protein
MSTILQDDALLSALQAMRIEPDGASLTFVERLARENGWCVHFAMRVYGEYQRFLYLAATAPHAVTPSDEVDQAWHLHLAYSRHYWDILCGEILKRPLHHGPTAGGTAERGRYHGQYEATRQLYQTAFGVVAPRDIWPDSSRRFGTHYRRIESGAHWVVPKKTVYALAPLPLLAGCTSKGIVAGLVVTIMLGLIAIAYLFARSVSANPTPSPDKKKGDGGGCGTTGISCTSESSSDSGCGGGCGGCGS